MKYPKKFTRLADRGAQLPPAVAMREMARLYYDNCGISLGMRTLAENAGACWQHEYERVGRLDFGDVSFVSLIPLMVEEYALDQEHLDRDYDVTVIEGEDLVKYSMVAVARLPERTAQALCAGIRSTVENCFPDEGYRGPDAPFIPIRKD